MIARILRWLRIPRCHYNLDGSKKVAYPHLERANKVGAHMARKTGEEFDAYLCRHCQRYHIGKRPGPFFQIIWETDDD